MCRGGPDPAIASTVSINENAPDVIPASAWTTAVNPPTSIVRASPGSWTTPPPSTSPITILRYLRVTVPPDETMLWVSSTPYCGQSARCDTRCNARGIAPGGAHEQLRGIRRVRRVGARLLPCRLRWHSRRPDRLLDDGRHQETGHELLRLEASQCRPPRAFTLVPAWQRISGESAAVAFPEAVPSVGSASGSRAITKDLQALGGTRDSNGKMPVMSGDAGRERVADTLVVPLAPPRPRAAWLWVAMVAGIGVATAGVGI